MSIENLKTDTHRLILVIDLLRVYTQANLNELKVTVQGRLDNLDSEINLLNLDVTKLQRLYNKLSSSFDANQLVLQNSVDEKASSLSFFQDLLTTLDSQTNINNVLINYGTKLAEDTISNIKTIKKVSNKMDFELGKVNKMLRIKTNELNKLKLKQYEATSFLGIIDDSLLLITHLQAINIVLADALRYDSSTLAIML